MTVREESCRLCAFCGSGKALTNHVRSEHGLGSEEYTVKHVLCLPGRPACLVDGCGDPVRYVALSFKRYCKRHSSLAESEAGRAGGKKKETWNRGRTAEQDPRIPRLVGSANHFFGRQHSDETLERISASKRITEDELMARIGRSPSDRYLEPRFSYSEYRSWQQGLAFSCRLCGQSTERCLMDIERGTRCKSCFPVGSMAEVEIADFVRSLGLDVVQNSRRVIPPKEVDVWVPGGKLAVEHHGLYWHSGGKDRGLEQVRGLHREKFELAQAAGVRLVQFFSDEWRDRRPICESMLRDRLHATNERVGARKCSLGELSVAEAQEFLEKSHIDGYVRSSLKLGLRQAGQLRCAITLRVPIQKRYGNVCEVARLATMTNAVVQGGASRLIREAAAWAMGRGFSGMLSYSDNRFGLGGVYARCGFSLVGETGVNYWYTDGARRFDRFAFRAQAGMTEREFAASRGVRPVYGSGHRIWLLKF